MWLMRDNCVLQSWVGISVTAGGDIEPHQLQTWTKWRWIVGVFGVVDGCKGNPSTLR
jgi:hypothetical protein